MKKCHETQGRETIGEREVFRGTLSCCSWMFRPRAAVRRLHPLGRRLDVLFRFFLVRRLVLRGARFLRLLLNS